VADDIVIRLQGMRIGDEIMVGDERAIQAAVDLIKAQQAKIELLRLAGDAALEHYNADGVIPDGLIGDWVVARGS
jgi:vancomycin permeability regulator SanA